MNIYAFNTTKVMDAMLDYDYDDDANVRLWNFFTSEFGENCEEDAFNSSNIFLNFGYSSIFVLLDFIYHVICIPITLIALFLEDLYEAIANNENRSILQRVGLAAASPFIGIIAALALTLALPTRLISTVISPIVDCVSDMSSEASDLSSTIRI